MGPFEPASPAPDGVDRCVAPSAILIEQLAVANGPTGVGVDLERAVFRTISTEVGLRLLSQAVALGEVTDLSKGEMPSATKTIDTRMDRARNLWRADVEGTCARQAASAKQTSDIAQGS